MELIELFLAPAVGPLGQVSAAGDAVGHHNMMHQGVTVVGCGGLAFIAARPVIHRSAGTGRVGTDADAGIGSCLGYVQAHLGAGSSMGLDDDDIRGRYRRVRTRCDTVRCFGADVLCLMDGGLDDNHNQEAGRNEDGYRKKPVIFHKLVPLIQNIK